jgi:hypothetical protein
MKKVYLFVLGLLIMAPGLVFATSTNGQGSTNGNAGSSSASTDSFTTDETTVTTQTRTQTQTNNPETGVMTQTQTQAEEQIQSEIGQASSQYTPKNSKGIEQRSIVANTTEELIRSAAQIENKGIGDQIRLVAQTQTKNQDKIGESIDKVETRSKLAKFFIGANYKELKLAKQVMNENQVQIQELEQIITQLTSDTEKIAIANQIIVLQQIQLELKDQLEELSNGFSLFGWINRWKNNF